MSLVFTVFALVIFFAMVIGWLSMIVGGLGMLIETSVEYVQRSVRWLTGTSNTGHTEKAAETKTRARGEGKKTLQDYMAPPDHPIFRQPPTIVLRGPIRPQQKGQAPADEDHGSPGPPGADA